MDKFHALAQERHLTLQQTNEMLRSSGQVMRYMNNVNEVVNRRRREAEHEWRHRDAIGNDLIN